jgi:hypothetical protein
MYVRKSPERFGNAFSRSFSIRQVTFPNEPALLALNEVCLARGAGTLVMRVVSEVIPREASRTLAAVYTEAANVAAHLALPTWRASAVGTTHSSRPFAGGPSHLSGGPYHCVSCAKNTKSP